MDISIAGIEEQWAVAQANAGRPMETTALMRAQILATLVAGGHGTAEVEAVFGRPDVSTTDLIDAVEVDRPGLDQEDGDDEDEDDIWADVERERKR